MRQFVLRRRPRSGMALAATLNWEIAATMMMMNLMNLKQPHHAGLVISKYGFATPHGGVPTLSILT